MSYNIPDDEHHWRKKVRPHLYANQQAAAAVPPRQQVGEAEELGAPPTPKQK